MNFSEAVELTKRGVKVTSCLDHVVDGYLGIDSDGELIWATSIGQLPFVGNRVCLGEWRLYEEPVKVLNHREVMQVLLNGGKIKKKYWTSGSFIILNGDGFIVDEDGTQWDLELSSYIDDEDFYIQV